MSKVFGYEVESSPNVKKVAESLAAAVVPFYDEMTNADIVAALSIILMRFIGELEPTKMAVVTSMPVSKFVAIAFEMAKCKMTPIGSFDPTNTNES